MFIKIVSNDVQIHGQHGPHFKSLFEPYGRHQVPILFCIKRPVKRFTVGSGVVAPRLRPNEASVYSWFRQTQAASKVRTRGYAFALPPWPGRGADRP
jgi:hypothetical protein